MNSMTINEMCKDINKYSEDNNVFHTAINLTDYYFQKKFHGTECDLIQKEYAYYICISVLEYLNKVKIRNETEVTENKFDIFLSDAKKRTLKTRRAILYHWLDYFRDKIESQNYAVAYLTKAYPSILMFDEVRKELGLVDNHPEYEEYNEFK